MTSFDIKRFRNVARWDLTVNRSFYIKAVSSIFFLMALPFVFSVLYTFAVWIFTDQVNVCRHEILFMAMLYIFIYAWMLIGGYTFHNLLTRQSRIAELTLPASNLEKYLWHTLLTVIGTFIVAFLSMAVVDVAQYLFAGVLKGFGNSHSIVVGIFSDFPELWEFIGSSKFPNMGHLIAVWLIWYIADIGIYVLGNAIKYKYNVILTILFKWVLSMAASVVCIVVIAFFADSIAEAFKTRGTPTIFNFLSSFPWIFTGYALGIAFNILIWWAAYRFYTRAQITSNRNI